MILGQDSQISARQELDFYDLGLKDYNQALAVQLHSVQHVLAGGRERVFLLEHYPVITLGRNGCTRNLLTDQDLLRSKGIQLASSSRGGDITCHFPGQLVVYPILRVEKRPGGLKVFFQAMEQVVINLLSGMGIDAGRVQGRTGVFTSRGKIASMGFAVKKWISYHGLALNVQKDLGLFEHINPCGMNQIKMTSIHQELCSEKPDMHCLKQDFCAQFLRLFGKQ